MYTTRHRRYHPIHALTLRRDVVLLTVCTSVAGVRCSGIVRCACSIFSVNLSELDIAGEGDEMHDRYVRSDSAERGAIEMEARDKNETISKPTRRSSTKISQQPSNNPAFRVDLRVKHELNYVLAELQQHRCSHHCAGSQTRNRSHFLSSPALVCDRQRAFEWL